MQFKCRSSLSPNKLKTCSRAIPHVGQRKRRHFHMSPAVQQVTTTGCAVVTGGAVVMDCAAGWRGRPTSGAVGQERAQVGTVRLHKARDQDDQNHQQLRARHDDVKPGTAGS
eukprot:GHRQ01014617.1.p1 GENE.GHRQ01014617.1~~GHRQ01014617.1.p1  ORF type:complete len:112 (-),score=15.49 GHRQ01014617.1:584-919(-)